MRIEVSFVQLLYIKYTIKSFPYTTLLREKILLSSFYEKKNAEPLFKSRGSANCIILRYFIIEKFLVKSENSCFLFQSTTAMSILMNN